MAEWVYCKENSCRYDVFCCCEVILVVGGSAYAKAMARQVKLVGIG